VDWDQTTADPDNVSTGIAAENEWWPRLQELIAAADVIVFVVSPDSARSNVCDEEIAYARALGKRVIAILYRSIDFHKAPPRLAALNVKISFVGDAAAYDKSLDQLASALALDVGWIRHVSRRPRTGGVRPSGRMTGCSKALTCARLRSGLRGVRQTHHPSRRSCSTSSRRAGTPRGPTSRYQRSSTHSIPRGRPRGARPTGKELKVRESRPRSGRPGVDYEMNTEKELIRSLLGLQIRWHPQGAHHVASTGGMEGYAEIFEFPCCAKKIKDFLATTGMGFRHLS
jgi:hypothetical protein